LHRLMAESVEAKGGEVSARIRAEELGIVYRRLSKTGRVRFLRKLARDFNFENDALIPNLTRLKTARNESERMDAIQAVRESLISPRMQILSQFNTFQDGFKFLVDMRADLLALSVNDAYLKGLEADLKYLLKSWFDVGLLDLEEINWNSPASLLEKLIVYEAVHTISSWSDLKNRLDSDRRCFAFFHYKMPNEPLIFIEVALTKGMVESVQLLLDERSPVGNPRETDTAIFYSISNAQKGLAGINLGNFLIKQVVAKLSSELKNIKTFATLSPVPGFRKWLDPLLEKGNESLLAPTDVSAVNRLSPEKNAARSLLALLHGPWHKDETASEVLKGPLMSLAARYLLLEKKAKRALDPVANFHISNGARLERINWLADTSSKGMQESAGIMVNYLYTLSHIEENHEAYATEGKIAFSKQVGAWLRE